MMKLLARGLIHFYRLVISPFLPPMCRFQPSCSEYALEAVQAHGALRGVALTLRRLARCHPWGGSGLDPVPLRAHNHDVPPRAHNHDSEPCKHTL